MRARSVHFSVLFFFALALTACGNDTPQQQGAGGAAQVGFITVKPEPYTVVNELPGRTTPYEVAEIRPQVSGIIKERLFEEGAEVEVGQVLYRIDDRQFKAALASAQADLASARATLESNRLLAERYKKLVEANAVSRQEYDNAQASLATNKAQIAAAQAAVETARLNLDYASVKAPISGRIGRSSVTAGALVTANQSEALATIRQLDPIYVDLTQSARELRQLRVAMESGQLEQVGEDKARVTLVLEDGTEYGQNGTLQFSEYAVDESTGSITLRALFPNPDGDLLPGLFVRAKLPQGQRDNAILVPQKAVTRDPQGTASALVIGDNNTVEKRQVETVRTVGNRWLIGDGLAAGDKLIVDGLQKIGPGMPVEGVDVEAQQQQAQQTQAQDNGPNNANAE
ncbi:efflux RND transporter periplasmic adaptor subunit [Alloalcanivorax xenomutans]|jgi:membrane fusion protein, multidrug efflux system|uniref:Efflux RND transporter periplasmic adaptor subunit n=1 Tax=Alloalcanivorax xenomutans TaxID=1094342 RepID=A0A9Q3ZBG3_9GAMM|nr:efflux RND transporter periplasmic adaptor subunit [Alloalcanivorax xenomutans]ERS15084.1 hemolysin D [Alcanivorax sp. PN-3]MBA4721613.1 efflux RND transporter periplasmic adaptor subunit [Alcanivorax sp.]ARB45340.1 hemolysin D [Alloalcanivorax xenomutans]MCE7507598.1 efflux RND transporter periplasmic adaptor subunit [Alloalcanivorax xenomutans]MCE7524712.1 efflux RND transporter periplasmic adaptor subunit [Alloalcanivorax xenomutans]